MDPLLIDEWLQGADAIDVRDDASVSVVRDRVRERSAKLGLPDTVAGALVNVASELARNQLAHADRGEIAVHELRRGEVAGIEIVAADRGKGIRSPSEAILGRARLAGSLGVGLAAVLELADEVDIDTRVGEGTCVWARKFAEPLTKRRQVGIFGRPLPGEITSGDHACFIRDGDSLLVAVVDGAGHGEPARQASNAAVRVVRERSRLALDVIVHDVNEALAGTRGGVMALARFTDQKNVEIASVGNVSVHVQGPQTARRAAGISALLGGRAPLRQVKVESVTMGPRDALVAFTDGLTTQTDANDLDLLREHPIAIAHTLATRFARATDDALVLVVR